MIFPDERYQHAFLIRRLGDLLKSLFASRVRLKRLAPLLLGVERSHDESSTIPLAGREVGRLGVIAPLERSKFNYVGGVLLGFSVGNAGSSAAWGHILIEHLIDIR